MLVLWTLFFLSCLGCQVASQSYGFTYPNRTDPQDENLVFALGETIDISWSSPFDAIKLAFIAEDGDIFTFFSQNNTDNDFSWAVNVNNSGSSSPFYYLYFENEDNNTEHYYSALFRVDTPVNANQSPSTAVATVTFTPSPTAQASPSINGGTTIYITQAITTASSAVGAITISSSGSTISTSTAVPAPSNQGLSQGAKAGIGVGVAFGVIAFASLVGLLVWRSRRRSRIVGSGGGMGMEQSSTNNPNNNVMHEALAGQPSAYAQNGAKLSTFQQQGGMHELSVGEPLVPQELEGDRAEAELPR